ncbi:MAG: adenosine kinase [Sphingomonadales bacterium]|nr:MAG: adenosine kinase [Sphingomonadales bacterium]
MSDQRLAVLGIGNAIVDVLSHATDDFLTAQALVKGSMRLIDEAEAERLYGLMGPGHEISGGSAANTIAGIAALGVPAGFIGKVRDDQLGAVFAHDIRAAGVEYATDAATDGASTARCLILVTPDGQRTMNTFLGASQGLNPSDLDAAQIARAEVIYLEGYLWDPPAAKEAFMAAIQIAHRQANKVALTLSDSFCVARYRDEFLELVPNHIDILFANEAEIKALTGTDDFDAAVAWARDACDIVAITRSEKGAVIVAGDETHVVPAEPGVHVVDTTGAGDLFAAGFLAGLAKGLPLETCGRMGVICAAEVISHMGARPEADLKALVARSL